MKEAIHITASIMTIILGLVTLCPMIKSCIWNDSEPETIAVNEVSKTEIIECDNDIAVNTEDYSTIDILFGPFINKDPINYGPLIDQHLHGFSGIFATIIISIVFAFCFGDIFALMAFTSMYFEHRQKRNAINRYSYEHDFQKYDTEMKEDFVIMRNCILIAIPLLFYICRFLGFF